MAARPAAAPASDPLEAIATRLLDLAGSVAAEAESATLMLRGLTDHAARIATLATTLEEAANVTEANVRQQAGALAAARGALSTNRPVVEALTRSVGGVAAISASIAQIARESRILSLNARIEAARAGDGASAFAVVAGEMSTLTGRTHRATGEIAERSATIARDIGAANDVVAAHGALVAEQGDLLDATLGSAAQQRDSATELAAITTDTAGTVDRAATAIGRVGANAVALKMLARQIARIAKRPA